MILVDTGPLVALFDRGDADHAACSRKLERMTQPLVTTVPVLTEALHLLSPGSKGAATLATFVQRQGLRTWFLSDAALQRAFELMAQYADRPMDLGDASLVAAAEALRTTTIFTLDRSFGVYRARIGRSLRVFRTV